MTSMATPPHQNRRRGDLTVKKANKRAPRASLPTGTSGGHRGAPGPTRKRALTHQRKSDLSADGGYTLPWTTSGPTVSSRAGRPRPDGAELAMTGGAATRQPEAIMLSSSLI